MFGIKYIAGLDLGQQQDYSVLSILELIIMDDLTPKYILRDIKRYPLKTDYMHIVLDVSSILNREELLSKSVFVMDYSGVGTPIYDLFKINMSNTYPIGVSIAGGNNTHWRTRSNAIVAKKDIVSTFQVVIQNKRLIIPYNLSLIREVEKEFLNFKAKLTKTASVIFEAKGSIYHDDIVMSIGVALWYSEYINKKGKRLRMVGGL